MHFSISPTAVVLGLIVGSTYGILAVGLVLVYRVNRIINFAHGEIGGFAASFMFIAVVQWGVPYWVSFPLALAFAAGVGALVEVGVIRRLRHAPRLMSVIATLGFAQLLSALSLLVAGQSRTGSLFPEPTGMPSFRVPGLLVTPAHTGMLFLTPLLAIGLAVFLRRSRYGIAMRAAAANPDAARLDGVGAARMSTLAWAIAGAISAFTAILVLPTLSFAGSSFGPNLVVRALAAAVIGRMSSFVVAFAAGLGVGVVEQVMLFNDPSGGQVEAALFGIILVALLLLRPQGTRRDEKGSVWASLQTLRPLPLAYQRIAALRHGGRILGGVGLLLALLVPLWMSAGNVLTMTVIFAMAIVGLSLVVITGLGGQLSLGQFAIAGIGAAVAVHTANATQNYLLGIIAGGIAGAVSSVVVGLPAMRIQGLMLAVTTLSLALMSQEWLLQQPALLGTGVDPGHPLLGTWRLDTAKSYYFLALGVLLLALWMTRHIRDGGMGRILVALRDNEDAARAFSVAATARKLQGYALAGVLAGVGGAVYGFGIARISTQTFPAQMSISIVAMAVIGGISLRIGPLLGALYMIGIPAFLPLDSAGLAAQAAGWLILVLYVPGGLAALIQPVRDHIARLVGRWAGVGGDAVVAGPSPDAATAETAAPTALLLPAAARSGDAPLAGDTEPLLVAEGLVKRYGGVAAVDGVSLSLHAGETVGLIGPNGAGKTTLFELLAGFTRPDEGRVVYAGRALDRTVRIADRLTLRHSASPERRTRLGLVRSFQDASLFPTMSVEEVVMLALERSQPTAVVASVTGSQELERPKRARARELIEMMGLEPFRGRRIAELSTGTRRITELCCVIALAPRLLLLDEPSSGIAQRETEALGDLLRRVKDHLGATLVVIEHDIPLVMGLADRIVAMESGRVIADGTPAAVRADERVVEAYLGGNLAAIERSGRAPQPATA